MYSNLFTWKSFYLKLNDEGFLFRAPPAISQAFFLLSDEQADNIERRFDPIGFRIDLLQAGAAIERHIDTVEFPHRFIARDPHRLADRLC
mgnify:CR=1 FL=1